LNAAIKIKNVSGTSYLVMKEINREYPTANITDGVINTCWSEGVQGYGVNEKITLAGVTWIWNKWI